MPRRLDHYPNAQYEQILARAAGGERLKIEFPTEREAVRFRNAYMSWRSVVLREHRAGRTPKLPFGFDEVATQQKGGTVRFLLREMTEQFQALERIVTEMVVEGPEAAGAASSSQSAQIGGTESHAMGGLK